MCLLIDSFFMITNSILEVKFIFSEIRLKNNTDAIFGFFAYERYNKIVKEIIVDKIHANAEI